jgi:hypothetical protein
MFPRNLVFLSIPLLLSAITHLWNPIGFPVPNVDEGIYLGRAVYLIDTSNLKDPYIGYDHPYFGQIFLAAYLYITGYQSLLNSSHGYLNYEMLLLIPRILMGLLAVLDTFFLFKIVEYRYNIKTAFIASVLFAVMPITWLTRWVLLDSIQLPFILLSILFSILPSKLGTSPNPSKNVILVLLSGTFLGISIFTKIPSFTLIPLIGYLVFMENKKSFKMLALWIIPVLLIPSMWPLHALSLGEFDEWWDEIIHQAHRESHAIYVALNDFFKIDGLFLIIGVSSLIYSVLKRDLFILLSVIPFLIFMYLIGYVDVNHLVVLVVILCISTGKLFVDILSFVRKKGHFLHLFTVGGIAAIMVVGLISTIMEISLDLNTQYFMAARFIDQYLKSDLSNNGSLKENNHGRITIVSHPFFFWVDKYKFQNKNNYYWHEDKFVTQKIISIIDGVFRQVIEEDAHYSKKFRNLFSAFDTRKLNSFNNNSTHDGRIDILLTNLNRYNKTKINLTNLLDEDHYWSNSNFVNIKRKNGVMNITADTTKANTTHNINHAFLNSTIDFTGPAVYLSISYFVPTNGKDTDFTLEIYDTEGNNTLWMHELRKSHRTTQNEFFILPDNISEKKVSLDIRIRSYENGIDSLLLRNLLVYN